LRAVPARATAAAFTTITAELASAATRCAHPNSTATATVTPPKQTYNLRSGPSLRHEMEAANVDDGPTKRQVLALALCRMP
jgi:hypothetical protein